MKKKFDKIRIFFAWIFFTIYIGTLFYFMFFSEHYGRTVTGGNREYNLEPFREIKRFWLYRRQLGVTNVIVNLLGNVLAFVPCGIAVPLLSREKRNFVVTILLTLEISLYIEVTQLVTNTGSFDVDDLLLNTFGGMIGYIFYKILARYRNRWRK